MSKNFDVLLRAEKESELFHGASVGPELLCTEQPRVRPPVHIDEKVRIEESKLVERVFVLPGQQAPRVVVFCGVEFLAGTTGLCARAGQHLAEQTRLPVCLVDADLHSPSLHDYFSVGNLSGVTKALSQPGPIRESVVATRTDSRLYARPRRHGVGVVFASRGFAYRGPIESLEIGPVVIASARTSPGVSLRVDFGAPGGSVR